MIAFLRLMFFGFLLLTVVYFAVSVWSRRVRRGKLGREWDEEIGVGDRDAFVRQGLRDYDGGLRRRLILGVYIVPMVVVGTIIYLVNYA